MTDKVKAKNISGRALCLAGGIVKPDDIAEMSRAEAIAHRGLLEIQIEAEKPAKPAPKPAKPATLEDMLGD